MMRALAPLVALMVIAAPVQAAPVVGGQLAAGFQPTDAAGTPRSLASLSGPSGLVLVFSRSAGWCPYCQVQMKELVAAVEPLAAKGFRLAALTYDDPAVLAKFAGRQSIPYPLLSDPGGKLIATMGLADPAYPVGHMAHGVPYPTVMVLDPSGRILALDISRDYRKRPATADVIAMAPAKKAPPR